MQQKFPFHRPPFLAALGLMLALAFTPGSPALAWVYRVQPGDTLFLLAQRYGVSLQQLEDANGIYSDALYIGQALWIPDQGWYYTVAPGDTLFSVAQRFGTTVSALQDANGLSAGAWLWVGQKLLIVPASTGSSGASGAVQLTAGERYLLAQLVQAEAAGEPFEGQVAVAAVVLNRLRAPGFPKTIPGVIYDDWAFESVYNGWLAQQIPSDTAFRAVDSALSGWDPTGGALYYYNPKKTDSGWMRTRPVTTVIGDHVFSR